MNNVISRVALAALTFLAPALAIASPSVFDGLNRTGTQHTFIQEEEQFVWEGGIVRSLKNNEFYFEDQSTTSSPEYEIRYRKWVPSSPNGRTIIYNHGLQSHSGWFIPTAEKLSKMGYTVFAFDRIGSGRSSEGMTFLPADLAPEGVATLSHGRGHIGHWGAFTKTLHLMKEAAKSQYPNHTIHIWANSFSAHIVTAYIMQYQPTDVRSYIFTSPGFFSKLPLPFPVEDLIGSAPGTYFPTTIPENNGDRGAYLFTSMPEYTRLIARDRLGLREFTKEFYFNVRAIQNFHFSAGGAPQSFLSQTRRFYLVVDGDPMMDTSATVNYVLQNSSNASLKRYSGGADNRHFLAFTEDADEVLEDIDAFIHGRAIFGDELQ